jgi:dolichol-phosphate mannosyltransferase
MPTYNEVESLGFSVNSIRELGFDLDVLIVDDNSPDGTGHLADDLSNSNTFVLHRKTKDGLGAAYLAGFDWAIARDYEVVIEMDADGSHQAKDLQKILDQVEKADLVLGSRWVNGGEVVNWPWYRKMISRVGNRYAKQMLGTKINDMTSGFRAFRVDFLKTLKFDGVSARGYGFQVEMALRTHRAGGRIIEVPIVFIERNFGRSKMTTAIVLEALWLVTKWSFYKSA